MTTPEMLTAAGYVRNGSELRARILLRPPVGAVVARTRYTVEVVAKVGPLWQVVETWTKTETKTKRKRRNNHESDAR